MCRVPIERQRYLLTCTKSSVIDLEVTSGKDVSTPRVDLNKDAHGIVFWKQVKTQKDGKNS